MDNVRAKREWATSDSTDETGLNNAVRKAVRKDCLKASFAYFKVESALEIKCTKFHSTERRG